jgi:tetratricopeptide (TPR) repeat protein
VVAAWLKRARPGNIRARRAYVLVRLRRYDEALSDLDAADRLDPKFAMTSVLRGGVYERLDGNLARVCPAWQQACRLDGCKQYHAECAGR